MITKNFTQKRVACDCEGRHWDWKDCNESYETAVENFTAEYNGYVKGIREVKKVFDEETFTITEYTIRQIKRKIDDDFVWNGDFEETFYEV